MSPQRIYPARIHFSTWFFFIFGVLFTVVGVASALESSSPFFWIFGGAFVLVGLLIIRAVMQAFRAANAFKRGTAKTPARIVSRHTEKQRMHVEQTDGEVETYSMELKFTPSQVEDTHEVIAIAYVVEPVFKKCNTMDTVNIEYALENPLMFLIEGEK